MAHRFPRFALNPRKRGLCLVVFLALAGPSVLLAQPETASVVRMGNGLTVILQEDHATDLVGIDVWVKAGVANETRETNGVSHLIEHLIFGATAKRKPGDVDREMESLGATLDAHTSWDWAHFNTTVSSRYLSKALEVLADSLTTAQFAEQELNREKLVILDEIAKNRGDASKVCRELMLREIYGDHPYGLPVEGTAESIRRITRDDVVSYHRKYYVPANMAVVLVGDIDKGHAVAEVGRSFQGLAAAAAPEVFERPTPKVPRQVNKSINAQLRTDFLVIGFVGPPGSAYEDVCAIDVLATYLGMGPRSWMREELVGRTGLALDVSADFLTQREPAAISVAVSCAGGSIARLKGAIFAKLATIQKEGIPEAALDWARRLVLGQFAFNRETVGGRANVYGFYFAVSDPMFAVRYIDCVQNTTNADIIRVAQRYLAPERAVVLAIGPDQGGSQ